MFINDLATKWRHDTQHNDILPNGNQHSKNVTPINVFDCVTPYALVVSIGPFMLSVIMLNVIMLTVMAPAKLLCKWNKNT